MRRLTALVAGVALLLAGCGDGASSTSAAPTATVAAGYIAPAQEMLTSGDVGRVVAQAVGEAHARSRPGTIAVTDRVGNVLAVYAMTGAPATAAIPLPPSGVGMDAQGLAVPATAAAIAKAITGAYLSSGGNAFSTRTASMIVQQHFPPAPSSNGLESGPLFGVQFSQLPCSDLATRFGAAGVGAAVGPKRSPLGLAADPGGLPLYKNGVLVGGVGVLADGVYGDDTNVLDVDDDDDEHVALAAVSGFAAPATITADRIALAGTTLRYLDATVGDLKSNPAAASYAALTAADGALVEVRGYYGNGGPQLLSGQPYGSEASGFRAATAADFSQADAFVLSDGVGNPRYPIRAATDTAEVAQPLTAAEVRTTLEQAFAVMRRTRGAIREPLDALAQMSIGIVDTRGQILGLVRAPDAPLFGTDVAVQKARSAAFLSGSYAGAALAASGSADVAGFVPAARAFLNDSQALTGRTALSARAVGNLARPYFPDGQENTPNGPFSRTLAQFNPFSTGLQSALIIGNIAQHLGFVAGAGADTPARCGAIPDTVPGQNRLSNGLQIFPGGVPLYRGGVLVGAIGVSGDGIDQDDMVAFLAANGASWSAGIGNAATGIRADQIVIGATRLRYVGCPPAPFIDSNEQSPCNGK